MISRCYLALGNLSFSLEFAAQAYSVEPRNTLSSYLLFTIFVEQKNVTEGTAGAHSTCESLAPHTHYSVQGTTAIRRLRVRPKSP